MHPPRVKNFRQNFEELNNIGFGFTNGHKCSDLHLFEKTKTSLWTNLN